MSKALLPKAFFAGAAAIALFAFAPQASFAAGDPPKPSSPDCSRFKEGSAGWKRCKAAERMDDDAVYGRGYTLAKSGDYTGALTALRSVSQQSDPRVQTMIGFSLRKLGHVDAAMSYYTAALAANPQATNTRQYLGEAFLQKNETARAKEQLAEIGRRCGTGCEDYTALSKAISEHEARG